jgi:hypothetical protein
MKKLIVLALLVASAFWGQGAPPTTLLPGTVGNTGGLALLGGYSVTTTGSTYTLAANEWWHYSIKISGTATTIVAPKNIGQTYTVTNSESGTITVGGSTGTTVAIAAGATVMVNCPDGANYVQVGSTGGSSGFPITIGSTSVPASSTTTAINGLSMPSPGPIGTTTPNVLEGSQSLSYSADASCITPGATLGGLACNLDEVNFNNYTYATTAPQILRTQEYSAQGPGWAQGGYKTGYGLSINDNIATSEIFTGIGGSINQNAAGDGGFIRIYDFGHQGVAFPSDEGHVEEAIYGGEGAYWFHGTVGGGTATQPTFSSTSLSACLSSSVSDTCIPPPPSWMIDTTTATGSGVLTGTSAAFNQSSISLPWIQQLPFTGTVPVVSVWGYKLGVNLVQTTTPDAPVSQTFTLQGGVGSLTSGSTVCVIGSNYSEESVLSAVSGSAGTQTLTLPLYNANTNIAVFQGSCQGISLNGPSTHLGHRTNYLSPGSIGGYLIYSVPLRGTNGAISIPQPGSEAATTDGSSDAGFQTFCAAQILKELATNAYLPVLSPGCAGMGTVGHTLEAPGFPENDISGLLIGAQMQTPSGGSGNILQPLEIRASGAGFAGNSFSLEVENDNPCSYYTACSGTIPNMLPPLFAFGVNEQGLGDSFGYYQNLMVSNFTPLTCVICFTNTFPGQTSLEIFNVGGTQLELNGIGTTPSWDLYASNFSVPQGNITIGGGGFNGSLFFGNAGGAVNLNYLGAITWKNGGQTAGITQPSPGVFSLDTTTGGNGLGTLNLHNLNIGGTCTGAGCASYPGAGIPLSTGSAWGTSYGTSGTGSVALTNSPTFVTPTLGAASGTSLSLTGIGGVGGIVTGTEGTAAGGSSGFDQMYAATVTHSWHMNNSGTDSTVMGSNTAAANALPKFLGGALIGPSSFTEVGGMAGTTLPFSSPTLIAGTPSSGALAALPTGAHGWACDESSTAGVPAPGVDYSICDSATHRILDSYNNGAVAPRALVPTAGTSGNYAVFKANGIDLQNGGPPLSLTTTGSSGAATYTGGVLNIPNYAGGGGLPSGTTGQGIYYAAPGTTGTATSDIIHTGATAGSPLGFNVASPLAQFDFAGNENHYGNGNTTAITISGTCTGGASSCTVSGTTGLPPVGTLLFGGNAGGTESVVTYTGASGTTISGLTWGIYGTPTNTQSGGTPVTLIAFELSNGAGNSPALAVLWNGSELHFPDNNDWNKALQGGYTGSFFGQGIVASSLAMGNSPYNMGLGGNNNVIAIYSAVGSLSQVGNIDSSGVYGYNTTTQAVTAGQTTFTPLSPVVYTTGTLPMSALATITVPSTSAFTTTGLTGEITLIGVNGTTVTSGNIANVCSATGVMNFYYILATATWWCK